MTNVALPCQSGVFESEAKIDNSRIEITTKPEGGNSSCKCYKNYRIEVGGIPQGDYMVVIDGRELGMGRIYKTKTNHGYEKNIIFNGVSDDFRLVRSDLCTEKTH